MVTPSIFLLSIDCKKKTCSIFNNLRYRSYKKLDFCKAFDDFNVFVSPRALNDGVDQTFGTFFFTNALSIEL